ncbi:MAG: polyamine aminopropyltransferase [Thaumarchaeota archaeon]|nr:polyamine aminopropyltransferase [Nitrososphaerota archaeon]
MEGLWILEMQDVGLAIIHKVKRIIYNGRTKYQRVEIAELEHFGKCLFLDGKLQSSERDEFVYHETLVHPAMLTHPEPKDVLVIGGGEGATIREVLKHECVERVVMVDIDEEVIKLVKEHMPEMSQGSFEDPRVELVIGDGRDYLKHHGGFDVVIVDVTDPVSGGPSYLLYTREFYTLVKDGLREGGLMVTQATTPILSNRCHHSILRTVGEVFPLLRPCYAFVWSYGTVWGFALASKGPDPLAIGEEELKRRVEERGLKFRFYSPKIHGLLFSLSELYAKGYESAEPITDERPVFMPA